METLRPGILVDVPRWALPIMVVAMFPNGSILGCNGKIYQPGQFRIRKNQYSTNGIHSEAFAYLENVGMTAPTEFEVGEVIIVKGPLNKVDFVIVYEVYPSHECIMDENARIVKFGDPNVAKTGFKY